MNLSFRTLFTLGVAHPYYAGPCPDFAFVVPAGTAALMRSGRLLAREREGTLHVLCELNGDGQPRAPIAGQTLRLGLRLLNPYFGNFTQLPAAFPSQAPLYTNAADPAALAADGTVRFVAPAFTHALAADERPATVSVRDAAGDEVRAETLAADDPRTSVSLDLAGAEPGRYALVESAGGVETETALYLDDELRAEAGVVVEVTVDDGFYDPPPVQPPALTVAFQPAADELRYYVVAPAYGDDAFASLEVTDAGAATDGRAEIVFDRVEHDDFEDPDPPPSLLSASEDRVVLFRSTAPLPRSERGRRRIQLGRSTGEVLIPSLPQPGAERARAQMIIHLSKP